MLNDRLSCVLAARVMATAVSRSASRSVLRPTGQMLGEDPPHSDPALPQNSLHTPNTSLMVQADHGRSAGLRL